MPDSTTIALICGLVGVVLTLTFKFILDYIRTTGAKKSVSNPPKPPPEEPPPPREPTRSSVPSDEPSWLTDTMNRRLMEKGVNLSEFASNIERLSKLQPATKGDLLEIRSSIDETIGNMQKSLAEVLTSLDLIRTSHEQVLMEIVTMTRNAGETREQIQKLDRAFSDHVVDIRMHQQRASSAKPIR